MKIAYWSIATGIFGVAIGVSTMAVISAKSQTKNRFVFEQKQKCRDLATKWEKENEPEVVGWVNYSLKRNSCVVETERFYESKDLKDTTSLHIRDLLTGETVWMRSCNGADCNQAMKDANNEFQSLL